MTQNTPFLPGLPPSVSGWGSEYGAADIIELPSASQQKTFLTGSNGPRPIWLHADFLLRGDEKGVVRPGFGTAYEPNGPAPLMPEARSVEDVLGHLTHAGLGDALRKARNDHIAAAKGEPRPNLKILRARVGLSQASLARRVGTSQSRIARIEAKREEMGLSFARRVAAVLSVSLDELATAYDA